MIRETLIPVRIRAPLAQNFINSVSVLMHHQSPCPVNHVGLAPLVIITSQNICASIHEREDCCHASLYIEPINCSVCFMPHAHQVTSSPSWCLCNVCLSQFASPLFCGGAPFKMYVSGTSAPPKKRGT